MHRPARLHRHTSAYLVTCHTYRHEPFLSDHLDLIRQAIAPKPHGAPYRVLAWVIEPNRIRVVVDPCGRPTAEIVDSVKTWFGWQYRIRTGHIGPIWEPRFIEESISDPSDLHEWIEAVEPEGRAVAVGAAV